MKVGFAHSDAIAGLIRSLAMAFVLSNAIASPLCSEKQVEICRLVSCPPFIPSLHNSSSNSRPSFLELLSRLLYRCQSDAR
jgi:hypothetical protein